MSNKLDLISGHFRKGFMWGTATASYQIEGAWNKNGKGVNIWDAHSHAEDKIEGGCNGDVACDSYHNYLEDVKIIKQMKNTHYRFSLSWSRLLPTGDVSNPNPDGITYYNKLIDALLAENTIPCVTLYHWDLPEAIHKKGGWQDDIIIEKFKEYARFCFEQFGDRVKMWITMNEPHVFTIYGYGAGFHAPGIKDPLFAPYQVSRRILLAHATAWRLYDTEFRSKQKGVVSITLNSDWSEPKDPNSKADQVAAEQYLQSTLGWFAHPVFIDGDYPAVMKELIAKKSEKMGLKESRLPTLTEEEKKLIKGTHDFFGLNHYTTRLCEPITEATKQFQMHPDLDVFVHPNPEWERAGSSWLYVVPWGLRKLLNFIAKNYGDPEIVITENGSSTKHPINEPGDVKQLNDVQRCRYVTAYLNEALKAHLLDGVNLHGYFLWSLMDNFEWAEGYTERFGLHYVDFEDPTRPRVPRKSAEIYRKIVEQNGFSEVPSLEF